MKSLFAFFGALLVILSSLPASAETLEEKLKGGGYEWILGKWADKESNGQAMKISYELRLDGHAVAVKLETPERKAEGLIALNPKSGDAGYVAVDNKGGGAIGKVTVEDGKIVMKLSYTGADGDGGKMGIVHERKDADGIRLIVHAMDGEGVLGETKQDVELVKVKE